MDDGRLHARRLASEALESLLQPTVSLEIAIRKAIRVAALRKNPAMRAWLELQLIDLSDVSGDAIRVRQTLEAAFGNDRERAESVTEDVVADYFNTRSISRFPDKIFALPISFLEDVLQNYRSTIARGGDVPRDVVQAYQDQSRILTRAKNRVEQYLIAIESDHNP